MYSNLPYRPGFSLGPYPHKKETTKNWLDDGLHRILERARFGVSKRRYRLQTIVSMVKQYEGGLDQLTDAVLDRKIIELRGQLIRFGLSDTRIAQSFALIREISQRSLGQRHFDVQLLGGWILINGLVAEMATGQGKTLTAALASCTAALAGIPVHVVTVNDYLAERDASLLKPLYNRLGLTVAAATGGMSAETRQAAYTMQIVHTTNKQIAFDYLRDRMAIGDDTGPLSLRFRQIHGGLVDSGKFFLRGLCFAIVDEIDSVLIDEARTPLIISKSNSDKYNENLYRQALALAQRLETNKDYILDSGARKLELTETGEANLADACRTLSGFWNARRRRNALIKQALIAIHFYQRDRQYVVENNKVQIIDEHTGRIMADRAWEQGLHQLIEAREGCEISGTREALARISYQRFFGRYLRLAGMSGTVQEVKDELASVYGLHVVAVPTHQPEKRIELPDRLYPSQERKWRAVVAKVGELNKIGRPVLIGTCTVSDSEHVSQLLRLAGLDHCVLNARQNRYEASIVEKAGRFGSITVATNMAGRGTDIPLDDKARESGGLHVIATQRNSSRRVDRQLCGRCARQGDPGSTQAFLSIEDPEIAVYYSPAILQVLSLLIQSKRAVPKWLVKLIASLPQKEMELQHWRIRKQTIKIEEQISRAMAFTGRLE